MLTVRLYISVQADGTHVCI